MLALSIVTILVLLSQLDIGAVGASIAPRAPLCWIAGYLVFVAAMLTAVEAGQVIRFITTGDLPAAVVAAGHPTHVVAGLDLSLVTPFMVLAAVWLWRRQAWGYVLATMLSVKGTVYMLALTASTASAAAAGVPDVASQILIWALIGAGNLAVAVLLIANVSPNPAGVELAAPAHGARP